MKVTIIGHENVDGMPITVETTYTNIRCIKKGIGHTWILITGHENTIFLNQDKNKIKYIEEENIKM
jgi:hypothetical protein